MKNLLITTLKIAISAGIIAYLVVDAVRDKEGTNPFTDMLQQPKRWDLLTASALLVGVGVTLTLIRWCYLVRALGIHFPMRDALRIGYLGYLFNLAPMGIVGGDLLKTVLLSREHPGNRAKALASVVVDRMVGLYILFVVASAAIALTGFWDKEAHEVQIVCRAVLATTAVGTLGVAILLLPGVTRGRWSGALARIPKVGVALESLIEAVQMYRRNHRVLLVSSAITVGVHVVFATSVYLVAAGLGITAVSYTDNLACYPVSSIASTVPLPAGPMEGALVFMYAKGLEVPRAQGLVVALVFRLITILLAVVGFCYYLGSRREVTEMMHEAEEEQAVPSEAAETFGEEAAAGCCHS